MDMAPVLLVLIIVATFIVVEKIADKQARERKQAKLHDQSVCSECGRDRR